MCSQPSASIAAGCDGRSLDEDLARLDADVGGEQGAPGGADLPLGVFRRQGGDLRAGLGQAIGLNHGRSPAESLAEGFRRYRPSADQDRAWSREVRVRLQQPDQLGRHQRENRDVSRDEGARHLFCVEAVEQHGGGPVDDRAQDDREPGDVAERQAAEPAVPGVDADVEGGPDRAEQEVAVGQPDRPRLARGAAGQDPALEVVHVVLAEQRQVRLGLGELGRVVQVDRRPLGGEHACPLGLGEPRAER